MSGLDPDGDIGPASEREIEYALAQWEFDFNDEMDDGRFAQGAVCDDMDRRFFATLAIMRDC